VFVQALVSKLSVEALDVRVFDRLAEQPAYALRQQGWTAVAIVDDPPPAPRRQAVTVPERIAEATKADRRGLYRKGSSESIQSVRRHAQLKADGWMFVRFTAERQARTIAESSARRA